MGGSVIPTRGYVETTIRSSLAPHSSRIYRGISLCVGPLTAIICSYLTPEQRAVLSKALQGVDIPIYSNCWVYNCIDRGSISITPDPFDAFLIHPPPA